MTVQQNRWLTWTPRLLAIAFIAFLALFALDVFGEYATIWETLVALFMHLLPNIILLLALLIAWRWQRIGGLVFLGLGIGSLLFFRTYEDLISFLIVSAPALLIGVLFLADGLRRR